MAREEYQGRQSYVINRRDNFESMGLTPQVINAPENGKLEFRPGVVVGLNENGEPSFFYTFDTELKYNLPDGLPRQTTISADPENQRFIIRNNTIILSYCDFTTGEFLSVF